MGDRNDFYYTIGRLSCSEAVRKTIPRARLAVFHTVLPHLDHLYCLRLAGPPVLRGANHHCADKFDQDGGCGLDVCLRSVRESGDRVRDPCSSDLRLQSGLSDSARPAIVQGLPKMLQIVFDLGAGVLALTSAAVGGLSRGRGTCAPVTTGSSSRGTSIAKVPE